MNQLTLTPTPPRCPNKPCRRPTLEHLHGHSWRCPKCRRGYDKATP